MIYIYLRILVVHAAEYIHRAGRSASLVGRGRNSPVSERGHHPLEFPSIQEGETGARHAER